MHTRHYLVSTPANVRKDSAAGIIESVSYFD